MRRLGLAWFIVLALLPPANAVAATPQFNGPFTIPSPNARPTGITLGPDGALWFAEHDVQKVGRLANGTVSESATLPGGATQPNGIAAGPDGKLWLTTRGGNGAIVDLTLAGPFEGPFSFTAPISSDPVEIVAGPGGALWFTDTKNDMIGRVALEGTITRFAITGGSRPYGIAPGPDGNLWYTLQGDKGRIGRMTPAGESDSFPTPTQDSDPTGIVAGPDGALWFTEPPKDKIGRITTAGRITEFPVTGGHPTDITLGPDGNLWFVQPDAIGRITPGGTADSWPTPKTPPPASKPVGIAAGADGNLWFTDDGRNAIGQITAGPGVDISAPADLTHSTVTLRGAIRPAAQTTTYYFEYGTTASYGTPTPAANAGNGTTPVDAAAPVGGLLPGREYHYRLVATNGTDTTRGPDRTFSTAATPENSLSPLDRTAPTQAAGP